MKKKVILLFFVFLLCMMWADDPHDVFIQVIDSGGNAPLEADLSFTATILDGPGGNTIGNTLDEDSFDCGYPSEEYEGLLEINLGQFSNWSPNDYMRVTVSVTTGEPDAIEEYQLTDANYQLFYGEDKIQLGIIEEETASPNETTGEMTFLFDYGNNTRADDIQVNVNSGVGSSGTMTVSQYERASYTIPNFSETINLGFDLDDRNISDAAATIYVEIRWTTPAPDLTTPKLIYKASDAAYWQFVTPDDDDTGTYTDGWDLNDDGGSEPDGYLYGVKFSLDDFTPGSATYTRWAIGEDTILDLQPAENVAILSNVIGTEESSTSLTLNWDKVIGASTYDILVSDTYDGTYSAETTGLTTRTGTVSLSNATSNTIKYYKIQGKNANYTDTAVSTDVMAGISYGVKTTLITNNALIAFPVDGYNSYTNASDLIGFIDECDCISQWDADTQSWNSMGRVFGEYAGWDTDLDFTLEPNTPVVFNVMSGIDNIVIAGDVNTSVQFTLAASTSEAYSYIYLPLDSSISTGQALAGDISNCTYVGKFNYNSQNWDEITTDNTADSVSPGDLLRIGITGSTPVTWPSRN